MQPSNPTGGGVPPSGVPVAPVPTELNVSVVAMGDGSQILLLIDTVVGRHAIFLNPDAVGPLCDALRQCEAQVRTGLTIVEGGGAAAQVLGAQGANGGRPNRALRRHPPQTN